MTPYWFPFLEPVTKARHQLLVIVHLLIFIFAVIILWWKQDAGIGGIARWSLPGLMAGIIEMQRRGERDAESKLESLKGLTYLVKGP